MAKLAINEVLKSRKIGGSWVDNCEVLFSRVAQGGEIFFQDSNTKLNCSGKLAFVTKGVAGDEVELVSPSSADFIRKKFLELKGTGTRIFVGVEDLKGVDKNSKTKKTNTYQCTVGSVTFQGVSLTSIFKDSGFGGVGAKSSASGTERQEISFINLVNGCVESFQKLFVFVEGARYPFQVLGAEKNQGRTSNSKEPLVDVWLTIVPWAQSFSETPTTKRLGISMKGESAPTLAGGGLLGLTKLAPEVMKTFYGKLKKYLSEGRLAGVGKKTTGDFVPVDDMPDFFMEIPSESVGKILRGDKSLGGPVDLMYVGKMDVLGEVGVINFGGKKNISVLKITNGKLRTLNEYKKSVEKFYIRLRKRDINNTQNIFDINKIPHIRIDFKTKTSSRGGRGGFPIVFSGENNVNLSRIVVEQKVSSTSVRL